MRELVIASNMIALARNRKGGSKRSAMLRMIMPFLSRDTGDKLAEAISKSDSAHFAREWDKVKKEITARLAIHHKKKHHATASALVGDSCPETPATCMTPMANIQIDQGQTGCTFSITDPQIVEMIKLVCERLLMNADPCPIPTRPVEPEKPFDANADMLELYDKLVTCRSL